MSGLLDDILKQVHGRIKKRKDDIDPGKRDEVAVTFQDLPGTLPADLQAVCVECVECHALVLRISTAQHQGDHNRWATEILGTRFYDGPPTSRPTPPPAPGGRAAR